MKKIGLDRNTKKIFVSIILLFVVAFSLMNMASQVNTNPIDQSSAFDTPEQAAKILMSQATFLNDGTPSTESIASTEYIDYENGTTMLIIDYHNGTMDVIKETMVMETSTLQLGEDTADQSLLVETPTSTEESTDWIPATQDALLEQDVLLGFTYQLVAFRWKILDVSADIVVMKGYCRVYINLNIGAGIRLPVRITLEYPEQMTVEHDYECYATLTPLDKPDFDEFYLVFQTNIEVAAGIWLPIVGWEENSWYFGPNLNWRRSFTTPLGPGNYFPIPSFEYTLLDVWIMALKLVVEPQLCSDKITAKFSTSGDATNGATLTWTAPNQKIPFTVHADDYDTTTDYARIELSDFRYYFSIFKLAFKLKLDFNSWIDWLTGDPTITLYTLDMSWLTDGLYLGVHPGTVGVVDVDVFVKKFGVDLIVTPTYQEIIPGDTGIYDIVVINRGNVGDTFSLLHSGLPSTWTCILSSEVAVTAYGSASVQLSIEPYRHWSTSPGDYPFTVTATSQQAPLYDLEATDSDSAKVHILPFYEVDIQVVPSTDVTDPGGTGVYSIEVTNLGNVLETFDLSLVYIDFNGAYRANPTVIQPDWSSLDETYITLNPGSYGGVELCIEVPNDWQSMETALYQFIAIAISQTDSSASDSDIGGLNVRVTKESMARYINLELQELIDSISDSTIHKGIKKSLLSKMESATKKKEQALEYILEGRNRRANNMLKACGNIMQAFINHIQAQNSKHIPESVANNWISQAQTIIDDIEITMATTT
ncbi:MAG: hypothetical protein JSW11_04265 [Candidatus Heimdallarchaeota archaeon]|nr:MAG: hypothetical protein JSW11_04265 [Candidatus Heimdallarchaeota archaeon]